MYTSKISSKCQITLPKGVRDSLGLRPGDTIAYAIRPDHTVQIKRAEPLDVVFHAALHPTLEEWGTAEDDEAFRDL